MEPTITDVIEQMDVEIRELRERDKRLSREQSQLAEQRAAIHAELANLSVAIKLFDQYAKRTKRAAIPREQEPLPLPVVGGIAESAAEILRQRGGEADLREVHESLLQSGKLKPTPHSRTTLWKTMARKPEMFEKIGQGRWRLAGRVGGDLDGNAEEVTVTT